MPSATDLSFEEEKLKKENEKRKLIPAGFFHPVEVVEADRVINEDMSAFFFQKINSLVNNQKMSDLIIKIGDKTLNSHLFLWKLQTTNHDIIKKTGSSSLPSSCSQSRDLKSDQEFNYEVDLSRFKRSSVVSFLKYVYTGKVLIGEESKKI